jgi:hypothetical protein
MSINYYARCAALRASPINPKENKKKKRQKKRKKKAIISRVLGLVCKVFGKKILPLLSKNQTTDKKSVEIYFTKYILTLQSNSDAPLPLLSFLFFWYVCDSYNLNYRIVRLIRHA